MTLKTVMGNNGLVLQHSNLSFSSVCLFVRQIFFFFLFLGEGEGLFAQNTKEMIRFLEAYL